MKEIGILIRLTARPEDFPADIRISNLDLPFDLEELPFVWVGIATDPESLAYLIPLYARASADEDKRTILWAIGLHRDPAVVVPFIERILAGKEREGIRAEAAACLGEQNDSQVSTFCSGRSRPTPSHEVRERAVEGLVEMDLPAAAEALISFALNGADRPFAARPCGDWPKKPVPRRSRSSSRSRAATRTRRSEGSDPCHPRSPGRSGLPYLISLVRTHPDETVRKRPWGRSAMSAAPKPSRSWRNGPGAATLGSSLS